MSALSDLMRCLPSEFEGIRADNVAELIWTAKERPDWLGDLKDLSFMPPFARQFIGYEVPIGPEVGGSTIVVGVLFDGAPGVVEWEVYAVADSTAVPLFSMTTAVDASGGLVGGITLHPTENAPRPNEAKAFSLILPAFVAVHLMNFESKYVSIDRVDVPPKLAAKYEKRHGVKPRGHHTLNIRPMVELLRAEGGLASGSDIVRALHTVRRHVRRLPSGKLTWVKPHLRGSAAKGGVSRTYVVHAPAENFEGVEV